MRKLRQHRADQSGRGKDRSRPGINATPGIFLALKPRGFHKQRKISIKPV
jgi:hypothetical protein